MVKSNTLPDNSLRELLIASAKAVLAKGMAYIANSAEAPNTKRRRLLFVLAFGKPASGFRLFSSGLILLSLQDW